MKSLKIPTKGHIEWSIHYFDGKRKNSWVPKKSRRKTDLESMKASGLPNVSRHGSAPSGWIMNEANNHVKHTIETLQSCITLTPTKKGSNQWKRAHQTGQRMQEIYLLKSSSLSTLSTSVLNSGVNKSEMIPRERRQMTSLLTNHKMTTLALPIKT